MAQPQYPKTPQSIPVQPNRKKKNPNEDQERPQRAHDTVVDEKLPRKPAHEHSEEIDEIRAPGRRLPENDVNTPNKMRPGSDL
jgi:hypothetical protein